MIGVISDTHGLLRSEAITALDGAELIVHAGDVGDPEILERLSEIAPVCAVRGNTDFGGWAGRLAHTEVVEAAPGVLVYVLHDIADLDLDPAFADMRVVVYGHTHRPAIDWRDGVLYFNPGAAGPRRFDLPVTVGRLFIGADGRLEPEIVDLAGE